MAYFPPSQYKFEQLICSWLLRTPKCNRMWQIVKGIYYDRGVLQAELSLFAESHISGSLVAGNWETQPVNPSTSRFPFPLYFLHFRRLDGKSNASDRLRHQSSWHRLSPSYIHSLWPPTCILLHILVDCRLPHVRAPLMLYIMAYRDRCPRAGVGWKERERERDEYRLHCKCQMAK